MSHDDRDKWNARYRESCPYSREEPSAFLLSLDELLPRTGRALDVAGGAGRNAVWLAQRGLAVTLVDISSEALTLARAQASRAGVALEACESDLESEPLPPDRSISSFPLTFYAASCSPASPSASPPGAGSSTCSPPGRTFCATPVHPPPSCSRTASYRAS